MNATTPAQRRDLAILARLVPPGSRVLDLGCGSGEVLAHLQAHHGCSGYGIEIADAGVLASMQRGIDVIQLNLEDGLALFDDQSFDVVLQLDTLQHLRNAERMLRGLKLEHRLPTLVIGEELERAKPDPLPYLTGLQRLGGRQRRQDAGQPRRQHRLA